MHQLKGKYEGETGYIIGTGRSIKNLSLDHFGPGPVIVLNYAYVIIEELDLSNDLYFMQKDRLLKVPKSGTLLLHVHESYKRYKDQNRGKLPDYDKIVIFDNKLLGLSPGTLVGGFSQQSAIRLIEWMGCVKLVLYGFDAITNADFTRANGEDFNDYNHHKYYQLQRNVMRKFKPRIEYKYIRA